MEVLARAMVLGLRLLQFAVLLRILLSWVDNSPHPDSRWKEALFNVTDPILNPLRRVIPPVGGMLDLSPMVAIILLQVLEALVQSFAPGGYAPSF